MEQDNPFKIPDGRRRAVIEAITPQIDAGQFPVKRTVGEEVLVEADVFTDGHDALSAVLKFRAKGEAQWSEIRMAPLLNDRWQGRFQVRELGSYFYTVEAWVDHFISWQKDLKKRVDAGQDVAVDLLAGAALVREAGNRAHGEDQEKLRQRASDLESEENSTSNRIALGLSSELTDLALRHPDRRFTTVFPKEFEVRVDRELARFSAWYEIFPRSCAAEPGKHGTFDDCARHLPQIAEMGFDVLYLPPIHPVGRTFRKGKNNRPVAEPGDLGSPWGIGAEEGGHKSVLPELGALEDFKRLVARSKELGLEIALDIAFQCSPDHPWVKEHPEWFRRRSDGTIQYAENPPKKYQDIYPFDFETEDWRGLWIELKSIFDFWIGQGVRIFRVDNPHTKSFPFWEWVLPALFDEHPDLIFLAEAFTRPRVMERLAKLGFNQSYNYFPWRNTKGELTEYLTLLTRTNLQQYLRPNLWPNTPDILTQYLQFGGRAAFMSRLVLASTLGASYGIYGPAFEVCENRPRDPGSEEYLDSEKYQLRHWDVKGHGNLRQLIGRVNRARKENPALQTNERLTFHPVDNEQILVYSKHTPGHENVILVVVNLDPHYKQSGWVALDLDTLGIALGENYQVHDLLTDARFLWHGPRNYVELDPNFVPAHLFRVRRRVRTERDFDYFM